MLNVTEELKKYKAIDMPSLEQKLGKIPEDTKNAIALYNKALDDVSTKNEDIAVIALKKALSIYPGFYEAINLMGLCYHSLGDEENARRMFEKVIQFDDSSIRASRYLDLLDGKIISDEERGKPHKTKTKPHATFQKNYFNQNTPRPSIHKFLAAFIIGVFCFGLFWLAVPTGKALITINRPQSESPLLQKLKEENEAANTRINDMDKSLRTVTDENTLLKEQLEEYQHWNALLRELQKKYAAADYRGVVVEVDKNLSGMNIPEDIKKEMDSLGTLAKPKALRQIYDNARKLYDANAKVKTLEGYVKSASEYQLAIRIMESLKEKPAYWAEIYYYGGKAVALSQTPSKEEAGTEAIGYFMKVIEGAPGTKLASYSQGRMNDIEQGRDLKH